MLDVVEIIRDTDAVSIEKSEKMTVDSGFGTRFLEAFSGSGWSRAEIAKRLGVSRPSVIDYANGRIPPSQTIVLIAELTGCSLDWLLRGIGNQHLLIDTTKTVRSLLIHPSPALREALERVSADRGLSVNEQVLAILRAGIVLSDDGAVDAELLEDLRFEMVVAPRRRKGKRQRQRSERRA